MWVILIKFCILLSTSAQLKYDIAWHWNDIVGWYFYLMLLQKLCPHNYSSKVGFSFYWFLFIDFLHSLFSFDCFTSITRLVSPDQWFFCNLMILQNRIYLYKYVLYNIHELPTLWFYSFIVMKNHYCWRKLR